MNDDDFIKKVDGFKDYFNLSLLDARELQMVSRACAAISNDVVYQIAKVDFNKLTAEIKNREKNKKKVIVKVKSTPSLDEKDAECYKKAVESFKN